ncbi:MAG: AraC family transcriptional regulator [Verrucomicrobiota bacterium]
MTPCPTNSCDRIPEALQGKPFSRLFKEMTGVAPGEFIVQHKMTEACHLLKETNLSCKEIAAQLGYGDTAAFSRSFRTDRGMSPMKFRKKGQLQ